MPYGARHTRRHTARTLTQLNELEKHCFFSKKKRKKKLAHSCYFDTNVNNRIVQIVHEHNVLNKAATAIEY